MGSPYAGSSSGGGSVYAQGGTSGSVYAGSGTAPGPAKPHHGSFFGNLVGGGESFLRGIGPGAVTLADDLLKPPPGGVLQSWEHPLRSFKKDPLNTQMLRPMLHSEAKYYSPLAHGDLGGFYKNFHANPFNLLLDAATVATLGGGAVAKGGKVLADAGAISKESKLAKLGEPTALTVPDLAKQMGQEGKDVVLRPSASNPVTKGRQVGINKLLNSRAVPNAAPIIGSEARLARHVVKGATVAGQSLALKSVPLTQAFGRLNKTEQAVWHLKMQHLDPEGWQNLMAEGAVKDPKGTEALMTSKLQDAKLNALYKNPRSSKRLMDALAKGHSAADLLTADKVARGIIDPVAAVERPYLPLRLQAGAKVVGKDAATDELPQGVHDLPGQSIPELAQRIADKGEMQPSYVPHSAEVDRKPFQSWRPGANPPMKPGSTRQNEATLLTKGMLNLHKNALADEMKLHARFVQRGDVHEALMQVAAKEPATGLPDKYRFLKTTSGQASAPYTQQAAGALKAEMESKQSLLDKYTSRDASLPDEQYAKDAEGHRLIVPDHVANSLALEAKPARGIAQHLLYNKPTTIWKHMVLGLRPAYMVNIIASQHILGALQMAGGTRGVTAYLNHLLPGARLGKLTDATIEDTMPEQAMATFSGSTGTTGVTGAAAKVYQGVMPATLRVETWLRRLMIEGWAKSSPQIVRAMAENGGDLNLAMRQIAKTDPQVLHEISSRVDHAQGNYRNYSPTEQKLRQIIPFYGWDRHIIQSTYRIMAERPALANLGQKVGQQGSQMTLAEFGRLPAYLQGIIGIKPSWLPGWLKRIEGVGTPVLASKAFEPFSSVADIGAAGGAVFGKPGTGSDQFSSVNPILTGALEYLTGKSLLTGTPLKGNIPGGLLTNIPARMALGLPQARLAETAAGWHPLGESKAPTASQDWLTQLLTLAGVPIKTLNVPRANSLAAKLP